MVRYVRSITLKLAGVGNVVKCSHTYIMPRDSGGQDSRTTRKPDSPNDTLVVHCYLTGI